MNPIMHLIAVMLVSMLTFNAMAETEITAKSFTEVVPGVFVRYGVHKEISKTTVPDIANHGFIVGEESVAIIDPGGSLHTAESTLQVIDRTINLPVSHVIVTHVHPDHSLGLPAYNNIDELTILGHPQLTNSLYANLEFFGDNFINQDDVAKLDALLSNQRIQPINSSHNIDLGNRTLVLTSFDSAHTTSDVTVLDETHKLLWAGDLLFIERLPALDGSLLGWIAALDRLDEMDITLVIPGHGLSGPWNELLKPQRKYLTDLLENTRNAIAEGVSLRQHLKISGNSSDTVKWKLFSEQHKTNLTRAYTELEWE